MLNVLKCLIIGWIMEENGLEARALPWISILHHVKTCVELPRELKSLLDGILSPSPVDIIHQERFSAPPHVVNLISVYSCKRVES